MERLLERAFIIPGINRQIGLDVVLDLVPFAGSTAAAVLGAYMAWEARNLGMSKWQMTRMAGNIGVDWLFGLIPWVGAIPDFFFRSNTRNLRIIKRHLDKHHAGTATIDAMAPPALALRRPDLLGQERPQQRRADGVFARGRRRPSGRPPDTHGSKRGCRRP